MATFGTAIKVGASIRVTNTGNPSSCSYSVPSTGYARLYCWGFTTQNNTGSTANLQYAYITIDGVIYKWATNGAPQEVLATPSRISGPATAAATGTKLEFTGQSPGAPIYVGPGSTIVVACEYSAGGIESTFIDGTLFSNG